ncbi:MAG: ABC transporter permease [Acidimicrobiia bacterium]|nr:ABC transporter permease [Acidimicrobiia bacterium]
MRLAWKEILRRRGRFLSVGITLLLINVLVLFLVSQLAGLDSGQTGAIRALDADLLTFDAGVDQSLFRSSVPVAAVQRARSVSGVSDAGAVGVLFGTGRTQVEVVPDDLFDMSVFGYEPGSPGEPANLVAGRLPRADESGVGAIDARARTDGVALGDVVYFAESDRPIEIVGFVEDSSFQLQPTLWVGLDTWEELLVAVRPERVSDDQRANLLAIDVESGADPDAVAQALDSGLTHTESVTTADAIAALPGFSEQRRTFLTIVGMTYLATAIVITLFFALITLEKSEQIGILKAIGARTRDLTASVLAQSLLLAIPAFLGAAALTLLVGAALPPELPFTVDTQAWLTVGLLTATVSVIGALLSFRRISRIDPANAIGGAGD